MSPAKAAITVSISLSGVRNERALRINGLGRVTDDANLLTPSAVQGYPPKIGIVVEVREAFLHCAKAPNRAGLWDPKRHINRQDLASNTEMLTDEVDGLTCEESEGKVPRWRGEACTS
jgi:predicted pyridoxine 5'-phosphate oxidase superfamily flavin-nucleotide-binding protein